MLPLGTGQSVLGHTRNHHRQKSSAAHPKQEPWATRGYEALEMWLVQIQMCYTCKIHTRLQDLVQKNVKYLINTLMLIIC